MKPIRYLSVCSGMEAASVAWEPLGFQPVGFSEIEPFPSAILKHRFPNIPNYGDLKKHKSWPIEQGAVDLLVGGTPCQSFSVAGLRKGLEDPRGDLCLTFLGIADRLKPKWIIWENVPGVLSSNGGRDFGSFLGALGQLGYGWAYRVLDAQHFGVPQRRRRVFVVACLGDWKSPAEVLSIAEGLRGHIEAGGIKRKRTSANASEGIGETKPIVIDRASFHQGINSKYDIHIEPSETMDALVARGPHAVGVIPIDLRNATRDPNKKDDVNRQGLGVGNDGDPSHTLTKGFINGVACPSIIQTSELRLRGKITEQSICPTLKASAKQGDSEPLAITFQPGNLMRRAGASPSTETFPTLTKDSGDQSAHVATEMSVRRLTPVECERLQGFPDNWSRIPWNGKQEEQCPDSPRYKACGNSMAVPCMRWIGERIQAHEKANQK